MKVCTSFNKNIVISIYTLIFILFISISWILYPNFDFTEDDISALGHPQQNPEGWMFWSIGMIITGIISLFFALEIKDQMINEYHRNGKISLTFLFLASFGIIGLGAVPQFSGDIFYFLHIFHAILGFGGLYLGTWFMILPFSKNEETRKKSHIMLLMGFGIPICFLIFQGIKISLYQVKNPGIWYLNFSFWEWMLLFGIFIAYLILISTTLKNSEKKKECLTKESN